MNTKKKIAVVVDNKNWCWTTTAENICHVLSKYKFTFFTSDEFKERLEVNDFADFDLIWFRGYSNSSLNEQSILKLKCKFISTIGTGGEKLEIRLDGAERTAKNGMGLIVQNQTALHSAYRRGYGNVWMIPNGVDNRLFFPSDKKNKKAVVGMAANTFGSRGTLKGAHLAQDVCDKLNMEYKEVNALLPLSHESMAEWYRTIDYYLQPSDSEGCSNSVMEAMASGLPVFICKDVGYHGEICRSAIDYHDGQVIFVERGVSDIVEKIKILDNNPHIKQRCIVNAMQFAQDHDWKHISPKYDAVLSQVLGMRAKRIKKKTTPKVGDSFYVEFRRTVPNSKFISGGRAVLGETKEYKKLKKYCEVI